MDARTEEERVQEVERGWVQEVERLEKQCPLSALAMPCKKRSNDKEADSIHSLMADKLLENAHGRHLDAKCPVHAHKLTARTGT